MNHSKKKPTERCIQVYKKGINTILDQTGYHIHVWIYAILIWVVISKCMTEPYHEHHYDNIITFGTIPDIRKFIHYKLWDLI